MTKLNGPDEHVQRKMRQKIAQRTDSGRVLTQSELVETDLDKIYEPIIDKIVSAAIRGDIDAVNRYAADGKKQLTRYVIEQRGEDFFRGEKVGRLQGHREAVSMFKSAIPKWGDMPDTLSADEMEGYRQANAYFERVIAAISKSTEEKG